MYSSTSFKRPVSQEGCHIRSPSWRAGPNRALCDDGGLPLESHEFKPQIHTSIIIIIVSHIEIFAVCLASKVGTAPQLGCPKNILDHMTIYM